MKIIFLDIDGVLTSHASTAKRKISIEWQLSEERLVDDLDIGCVNCLKDIIGKTNANIVVSSSWRKLFNKDTLVKHLNKYGITNIIDITPNLNSYRGDEIQAWLNKHKDVEKFIILDDNDDMLQLSKRLIKTNWKYGIEDYQANIAIEMLS